MTRPPTLWDLVMQRGRADRKPYASEFQIEAILAEFIFTDSPNAWILQAARDLTTYPVHDAIATWLGDRDHLLSDRLINKGTYQAIHDVARQYADRNL